MRLFPVLGFVTIFAEEDESSRLIAHGTSETPAPLEKKKADAWLNRNKRDACTIDSETPVPLETQNNTNKKTQIKGFVVWDGLEPPMRRGVDFQSISATADTAPPLPSRYFEMISFISTLPFPVFKNFSRSIASFFSKLDSV